MRHMIAPWLLLILVAALPALAAGPTGTVVPRSTHADWDPPWKELVFQAKKLFFTATVRITVREITSGDALEEMIATGGSPEGLLPEGGTVDRIHVTAIMTTGKTEIADAWIDHDTGAVLQSIKEVHGKGNYWKLRRYFADGYHQIRQAPA
ncbi:MAG TPA: hypothetical protein ENK19_12360, partial [Acidobacteria bacterium]|nr:hypothetical protein [Acidobacteriota bacterium]